MSQAAKKPGIKGRYEVQEIVQEAQTRRPLRRLRTNLPYQNPQGHSAAESRARRTPTRRTGSHALSPGSWGTPRCISARSQPGLQETRLHASPGQGGRHGSGGQGVFGGEDERDKRGLRRAKAARGVRCCGWCGNRLTGRLQVEEPPEDLFE